VGAALRYLLDTHALLWWWTDDPQLSAHACSLIADERHEIFVSAASAWEIATKHRLGKLPEAGAAIPRFNELLQADGFRHLPVSYLHVLKAGAYPYPHPHPPEAGKTWHPFR
jgi:PIN domain nuclease of toxin-antitoxin system